MTEMSQTTSKRAKRINEVRSVQNPESPATQAKEGEFLKRVRLRRLDLRTMHGTLRESAKIYRELASGRITMAAAEIRSRVLRRHGELLNAFEQEKQLAAIQSQLNEIRSDQFPLLPAVNAEKEPST